jgi:hypothetical protein
MGSVLRGFDRRAESEQLEIDRQEKALSDYQAQLRRPFEHEARLKEWLAKQAELNAELDLDKRDAQVVAEPEGEKATPATFSGRIRQEEPMSIAHWVR